MQEAKPRKHGQGSMEYLLLIAGAVLVSVVVLVLIIATTSTSGGFINQNLNTYANLGGGGPVGGNPFCGDGTCDIGETFSSCPQDCSSPLPIVTIVAVDSIASEDLLLLDNGTFTITRTGSTAASLVVQIETDTGTATDGTDFDVIVSSIIIPAGTPIMIPAGASSVDVDIVPIDDSTSEGTETAFITVIDPGAAGTYAAGNPSSDFVQIVDDEPPIPESVALTVPDPVADEEDTTPTGYGKFTLTRSGSSQAQLALDLVIDIGIAGAATNGTDYQLISNIVTIPAGTTTADVLVKPIIDSSNEGDESVILTVQPNSLYVIAGPISGTVTISDNDPTSTLPVVTLTVPDSVASEPGTNTGTFRVTRSVVDTSVLQVNVTLSGTATNGADYMTTPIPVTIPAGQASADIIITPQDDGLVEGVETVVGTLAASPLAYTIGTPSFGSINILDDDNPPVSLDVCTNYNKGAVNKPGSFPTYSSIFQQSWTWRRTLNPATDIDIGTGLDSTSLITSFNSAACGSTIVVHNLTGNELNGLKFNGKNCPTNSPIHVYFVNPVVISGAGDVIGIDNVHGLVIDGMGNLTVKAALGSAPRALFFIGHHTVGSSGTTAATRIVIKNLEADGTYHPTIATKSKWGMFGENNTDLGFCNLNIHDIWYEHGFYFHTMAGNFEVVESKIENVGRTCVQLRNDWPGTPNTNYIIANNDCSYQRNGGAITADDASGTWWIHGNRTTHTVQGFVSIDSDQVPYYDHRDGEVFYYDNQTRMGDVPVKYPSNWQYTVPATPVWGGNGSALVASFFNIGDGGAKFFSQDNTFVMVSGASLNFYNKQYITPTPPKYPNELTQSENNTFGLGHPSHNGNSNPRITRWDTAGGSCFISQSEWTSTSNKCGKPPQPYDATGTFINKWTDPTGYNNLLSLFNGMP